MAEQKLNPREVKDYWTGQANEHGQSPAASWSDQPVIEMEIQRILERIHDGQAVLDIGCANGFTTINLASKKKVSIRGIDYIPEMIVQAKERLDREGEKLLGSVEFAVGDILNLSESSNAYDCVLVVRVLINLGTWENQLRAVKECARVLKPGGTLLLSEASLQGWKALNSFRAEWGLPKIPVPAFNYYVDEEKLAGSVSDCLELVDIVNFSSTYYVGTRVFKPLLSGLMKTPIDVASPDMEWNRFFSQLPACGEYGTQKLFVFTKP